MCWIFSACSTVHCSSSSTLLCAMGGCSEWTESRGFWLGSAGDGRAESEVRYLFLCCFPAGPQWQWLQSLTEGIADAIGPLPRYPQPSPCLMYGGGCFLCEHLPLSAWGLFLAMGACLHHAQGRAKVLDSWYPQGAALNQWCMGIGG